MAATTTPLTIEDFERLPYEQTQNCELVDGELVPVSGNNPEHNEIRDLLIELSRPVVRKQGLGKVLAELRRRDIQSVLVEGGATVAGAFLDAGLVNKVTVFVAPLIIGGSEAPSAIGGLGAAKISDAWQLEGVEIVRHGSDLEITGYPAKAKDEG